ncbi:transporter [Photobacterium gaetbulicola]|uniref:Transporter n=2 Tax=Photobacterium gaetbulicola TaxID=1295392 RepID=A0A0B9GYB1_9GAMM|nr:helix-hairpin-helix domain-containing protein [Photobacterium gaetbulicola]AJR09426.1 putative DNA uptake protein [Photobacterium gaetbulicola Gung47]KHT61632.1 transporter [Photobacterium gaetbulicola]PSU14226.1 transporter [Photobacterium gaetbulicola]
MKRVLVSLPLVVGLAFGMAAPASATGDSHEGIEITVNINDANAEELDKLLVGIGPDKAASIIEYRQLNGPFESAEDLIKVKGIGTSTVEKNRERIKLQ